jgi:predicted 3-demethylubiquinone-9 3-methyltransferase (glyoxalase superfamily)
MIQKITPNLWFNGNAKEAAEYYVSVFPDSMVLSVMNYPNSKEEGLADFQLDLAGKPLVVEFELSGQHFTGINAGPEFTFSEAISFAITCKDQEEIDYYWSKLSAVPEAEQCGWCKDQFGLSWQVVPQDMEALMEKPGAYEKMMEMKKLVIADF